MLSLLLLLFITIYLFTYFLLLSIVLSLFDYYFFIFYAKIVKKKK